MNRIVVTIGLLLLVFSGFFIGRATIREKEVQTIHLPYLSKRVTENVGNDNFVKFADLRTLLREHFRSENLNGSLYFEYLPTGTSIRINGDELEVGASLLKVPVAMELLKAEELGLIDTNEIVTIEDGWLDSSFGELYKKGAGHQIKLRDAMKIMLDDSDNTALNAIASKLTGTITDIDSAISSLDIDIVQNKDQTLSLSPRSYSSILKCLYFSCYLNYDHSQEILELLTSSKYPERIVAGVNDPDVAIAHKTGNYNQGTQSDCGIVYLKNRHYVLCVMLNVDSTPKGDEEIAKIARIVHDYIRDL